MTMTEEPSALDLRTKSEALEKAMADTQRELATSCSPETYAAEDLERTKGQFNEYVTKAKALEAEFGVEALQGCRPEHVPGPGVPGRHGRARRPGRLSWDGQRPPPADDPR